jgi:hypothetical protein
MIKAADAVARLAPLDFAFKQLQIGDLPLYNQDDDTAPAASVKRLKAGIAKDFRAGIVADQRVQENHAGGAAGDLSSYPHRP